MKNSEYRSADGVSRSQLIVLLNQTPMHFKYKEDHKEEEESKALIFGRAAHKFILEEETFFDEYAIIPECDRRTKEGKELYANFLLESDEKEVISKSDFDEISDMKKSIEAYPLAKQLLTGECEQSFFWTDSDTGEKCKVRPDCITSFDGKKYIVDYKTTSSCQDGHFERSVRDYGYKMQAGMYREGYFQNTFEDVGFAFVDQEKKPPYATRVYFCSEDFIAAGYEQFKKAISLYHWCKENDNWYGYEGADNIATTLFEEGEE